jgi:hypothetical protein
MSRAFDEAIARLKALPSIDVIDEGFRVATKDSGSRVAAVQDKFVRLIQTLFA